MSGFKTLFFKLATPVSSCISLPLLRKLSGIYHIVPVYHMVTDSVPKHIKYLYPVKDTKTFQEDLETLLKYYKPITLQKLIQHAEEGSEPKEPVFHLTFDDGLSEFFSIIAPILKEKGIHATCFLNNDFISNRKMFFRFKESLLIDHLHQQSTGSDAWNIFHNWTKKNNLGMGYYRKIILSINYNNCHLLDELASGLHIDFQQYLDKTKPYLDKKQVKLLMSDGFTFGAHSTDHIEYRFIDEEEQLEKTKASMNNLIQEFGMDYRVFSFPFTDFGVSQSFYQRIKEENIASLTFGCAGIKRDFDPISQQRIPIELYHETCKTALKKEYLYFMFLKATGRGRMKRN